MSMPDESKNEEPLETTDDEEISAEEFEKLSSEAPPNLLNGVQNKLHQRSGGRFYRDRFSRMHATTITLWITAAVIIGACALWLLLNQ